MSFPRRRHLRARAISRPAAGFSLLELLVALVISAAILGGLLAFTDTVESAWRKTSADPYSEAAEAFETLVGHVSAATLEPYQDYADSTGAFLTTGMANFAPDHLARRSDLAFVCGPAGGTSGWLNGSGRSTAGHCVFFVAPQGYTQTGAHLGLERLLNAFGYFVEFSAEDDAPAFLPSTSQRWRWRLKEIVQPSESLGVFSTGPSVAWVQGLAPRGGPASVLADNVIALVVQPERGAGNNGNPLTTDYRYDSRATSGSPTRNQIPARLRLALVVIDENSARVLAAKNGFLPPALIPSGLFQIATEMDMDLAALDIDLTQAQIKHRIFQRDITLPGAAWSETGSP